MLPLPFVQRASWIWSAEGTHAVPPAGQASPSHYQVRYFRRGFELADTIRVNVRNGLRLEDALPVAATREGGVTYFYNMEFHEPAISTDGKILSLGGFRFGLRLPVNTNGTYTYQDVGIASPLTIYQDQKQILGKVKLQSSSPDDLFVVLSYKLK